MGLRFIVSFRLIKQLFVQNNIQVWQNNLLIINPLHLYTTLCLVCCCFLNQQHASTVWGETTADLWCWCWMIRTAVLIRQLLFVYFHGTVKKSENDWVCRLTESRSSQTLYRLSSKTTAENVETAVTQLIKHKYTQKI